MSTAVQIKCVAVRACVLDHCPRLQEVTKDQVWFLKKELHRPDGKEMVVLESEG
jgi:hypothetical protein